MVKSVMKRGARDPVGVPYQLTLEAICAGAGCVWEQDYIYIYTAIVAVAYKFHAGGLGGPLPLFITIHVGGGPLLLFITIHVWPIKQQ